MRISSEKITVLGCISLVWAIIGNIIITKIVYGGMVSAKYFSILHLIALPTYLSFKITYIFDIISNTVVGILSIIISSIIVFGLFSVIKRKK